MLINFRLVLPFFYIFMTCNLQRKIKFTITFKIKKIKIKKRTKNAINNIKKKY